MLKVFKLTNTTFRNVLKTFIQYIVFSFLTSRRGRSIIVCVAPRTSYAFGDNLNFNRRAYLLLNIIQYIVFTLLTNNNIYVIVALFHVVEAKHERLRESSCNEGY